mmetsp:Transcript_7794/g.22817  ORF Transcript_7794/g.22817 Transcript_7794/m.22817 type:complete len:449 (-) Transcript_7794:143-1489(-)
MPKEEGHSAEAMFAMLAFSACSSSLLLINKLVIHYIPMPSFVSTAQFAVCTIFILGLRITGAAEVDGFEWEKVKPYLYYTIMFVCTIYCNMKALQYSNIETIIVFRSCVPLVVSQLDYLFLGRQLPSPASTGALLVLVAGAAGYVLSDAAFKLNGWNAYSWATAYFFIISVEMAYGKHIVGPHLKFKSLWGPTIYTNALAVLPMLAVGARHCGRPVPPPLSVRGSQAGGCVGLLSSEASRADSAVWSGSTLLLLAVSCIIGTAISFFGWYCRSLVTATCYTVLGVANKMLTVLANLLLWDKHASPVGIACLLVCLAGATAYKQAPPRPDGTDIWLHSALQSPAARRTAAVGSAVLLLGGAGTAFVAGRQPQAGSTAVGVSAAPLAHPPPHPHREKLKAMRQRQGRANSTHSHRGRPGPHPHHPPSPLAPEARSVMEAAGGAERDRRGL